MRGIHPAFVALCCVLVITANNLTMMGVHPSWAVPEIIALTAALLALEATSAIRYRPATHRTATVPQAHTDGEQG